MLPFIASFFLSAIITPAHTVAVPVTDDGDEVILAWPNAAVIVTPVEGVVVDGFADLVGGIARRQLAGTCHH
jgi:hypothetical protein